LPSVTVSVGCAHGGGAILVERAAAALNAENEQRRTRTESIGLRSVR
jgi:hypothetical protein